MEEEEGKASPQLSGHETPHHPLTEGSDEGSAGVQNPQTWSTAKKTINITIVALLALIPPLSSSAIVPGVPLVASDFDETRKPVISLFVSIFVLGFGIGPVVLAPLSELYGRRIVYCVCNVVTFAFTVGCALAPNVPSFVIFRFICGCVGAGPMNIGGASIADQVAPEKRGRVFSLFFASIFLGPIIGPIIGGPIAQTIGWRWVFWVMAIFAGVMSIVTLLFLSESHYPTLLAKASSSSPTGPSPKAVNPSKAILRATIRPLFMLTHSPIVAGLSLYVALIYGYVYLLFTTFSEVFPQQYGFDTTLLGVSFLGMGVGMVLALVFLAWFSDWSHAKLTKRFGGKSKPEYRLIPLLFGIPLLPIGLFVYGWTAQYKVHWIVPIIFTGLTGAGLIFSFLPTQVYMVDAFTTYAASGLAATSVVRSVFGGLLPLAGLSMYSALGYGWGNSLLGFVALAFSMAPVLFWKYGETLRTRYPIKLD